MLPSTEGIFRQGRGVLRDGPSNIRDDTPAIVTFLESGSIDLRNRGIDESQAAELRTRLEPFAREWDSAEMDIYNDYDSAKAQLRTIP
jgi:hypothetical protein